MSYARIQGIILILIVSFMIHEYVGYLVTAACVTQYLVYRYELWKMNHAYDPPKKKKR